MRKKKRVLVTGAAGMIGSHLCDRLMGTGEYEVIAIDDLSVGSRANLAGSLDRPGFSFFQLDVRDREGLRRAAQETDVVVHLAARKKIGEAQPGIETLTVNAQGTENTLEIARAEGAKLVFASTSDVYGMSPDLPFREDGDLLIGPSMVKRWSYAVSKLYGEQLAFAYHKDFGVPIVVLRYFGGFSERASFTWSGGHVPLFVDAVLKDEPMIVHGDGSQTRSMGYVEDLVEGTCLALEAPAAVGEIVNLGNPEEVSVLDCARLVHRLAGKTGEPKIKFVPFAEVFGQYRDIQRRRPEISKAKRLLGWEPRHSFEDALRLLIDARRRILSGAPSAPAR